MGQLVEVLDPHAIVPKSIDINEVEHVQIGFDVVFAGQPPHLNGFIEIKD